MPRARRDLRSAAASVASPASVRVASYTRKSTSAGLDRNFTSLDNQRERAEAFIESQRDQGWVCLSTAYDDGGFSGGNTDRPALQRLLHDVEAGLLDAIVVYRLDRISRSLADFVRIHEFLEKHRVALVSVTESINTQTPHGRMMVNVLLSFAQYERELVAERTSDKISAARRRGKWTGGMPPLGYDTASEGGMIIVNKTEADQVRAIFQMYADEPSLVQVAQELNRRGWRRKSWTTKTGNFRQGREWDRVTLSRLLQDPLYIGKQKLGDQVFAGEHERIVKTKLFDKVQKLMDTNRRTGGASARNQYGVLLRGLLHCAACDRAMTHAPTKRSGRVHRYYRCQGAQKNGHGTCPTKSISADKIETFVVDQIRRIGADPALQEETFRQALAQVKAQRRGLRLESKRIKNELARAQENIGRLTQTLSRVQGPTGDAIAEELGKAQELVTTLRARQAEVTVELDAIKDQDVNRDDLARALKAFDPIWDVLLTSEKERALRLLIERIDYDGSIGKLEIAWRLAGFGQLAEEIGS